MARTISYAFGAILGALGIWGFVQSPILTVFDSNTYMSVMHLASGAVLLGMAAWWTHNVAFGLKIFGIVYALLAILGFVMDGDMIVGLFDNTVSNNVLHTLLAIVFLWAGFMATDIAIEPPTQPAL